MKAAALSHKRRQRRIHAIRLDQFQIDRARLVKKQYVDALPMIRDFLGFASVSEEGTEPVGGVLNGRHRYCDMIYLHLVVPVPAGQRRSLAARY